MKIEIKNEINRNKTKNINSQEKNKQLENRMEKRTLCKSVADLNNQVNQSLNILNNQTELKYNFKLNTN